jgi:hypothetical protein
MSKIKHRLFKKNGGLKLMLAWRHGDEVIVTFSSFCSVSRLHPVALSSKCVNVEFSSQSSATNQLRGFSPLANYTEQWRQRCPHRDCYLQLHTMCYNFHLKCSNICSQSRAKWWNFSKLYLLCSYAILSGNCYKDVTHCMQLKIAISMRTLLPSLL